jgi:predicted nucleic acid-binding protein
MTAPCFVDASVFIRARDPRDPLTQQRAAEWIDWLWQQRAGRTSMQVLGEFYAAATRQLKLDEDLAWDEVKRYLAWTPLPTDEALLRGAREVERRYKLAWWDSMAVAAAQLQDCAILASEDLADGMSFGMLKVRNPCTSVLEEPLAAYRVQAAQLHRPRGRPRRAKARSICSSIARPSGP